MPALPRYDVHAHAFHPKIAAKVVSQLESHYRIPAIGTGLYEDLAPRLQAAGISYCCIHSAATKGEQVVPANRWAASLLERPGVIPFGTMHPDFQDMEEELAFLWDSGIRGIKLHPDFQGFWLNDERLDPLFAAMEGRFTLMVHVGDIYPPEQNPTCPYKVAALKRRFPKLQMIAAHFGGVHHWKYVVDAMAGMEIFMDTSSSLFAIPQDTLEQIYHAFPRHLFLFGSDYPLFDAPSEMRLLQERLRLPDSELEELMTNAGQLGLVTREAPATWTETAPR